MGNVLVVAHAATAIGQIANQAYFFLILRFLSPTEVGIYSWAVAIATIYTYVLDLGLATYLVGELSSRTYRYRDVLKLLLVSRLPLFLVGGGAVLVGAHYGSMTAAELHSLNLVGLAYIVQLFDVGLASWFQVRQRQNALNLASCFLPVSRIIGTLALWGAGQLTLHTIVELTAATQILNTAGFLVWAAREARADATHRSSEDGFGVLFRRFVSRGPRLAFMYGVVAVQTRLDWVLVSAFLTKTALANYSLANKIVEVAMLAAAIWAKTSFPWFSSATAEHPQMSGRLSLLRRIFVVFSMIMACLLALWSTAILHLLFGLKYAGADPAVRAMVPFAGFFMVNQFLFYVVLARNSERQYIPSVVLATILQVGTDLLLIPRVGTVGAAFGMIVMGLTQHIGQVWVLRRDRGYERHELLRQELFLFGGTGVLVLAVCYAKPLVGSVLALAVVTALAGGLVLGRADRRQIVEWMQANRWPIISQ